MAQEKLLINKTNDGLCQLILNRPDVHNAFDDELIADLNLALLELEKDTSTRVVILKARGKNFSAGADLNWMQSMANYTEAENIQDSKQLASLMARLNNLNKPTIAVVQGAAFGGGVGLVACCDMAIASDNASFCLAEVKLGIIPAVISPYVIQAMGERNARRYFLTAERFNAAEAYRLGLIHEVVTEPELDNKANEMADSLIKNAPNAINEAKKLIQYMCNKEVNTTLIDETAEWIAKLRVSAEGQEGLKAFLEKRKPNWQLN